MESRNVSKCSWTQQKFKEGVHPPQRRRMVGGGGGGEYKFNLLLPPELFNPFPAKKKEIKWTWVKSQEI